MIHATGRPAHGRGDRDDVTRSRVLRIGCAGWRCPGQSRGKEQALPPGSGSTTHDPADRGQETQSSMRSDFIEHKSRTERVDVPVLTWSTVGPAWRQRCRSLCQEPHLAVSDSLHQDHGEVRTKCCVRSPEALGDLGRPGSRAWGPAPAHPVAAWHGRRSGGSRRCRIGSAKAAVLPVPVCAAQQVASGPRRRNGLGLNRSRIGSSLGRDRTEEWGTEAEIGELGQVKFFRCERPHGRDPCGPTAPAATSGGQFGCPACLGDLVGGAWPRAGSASRGAITRPATEILAIAMQH